MVITDRHTFIYLYEKETELINQVTQLNKQLGEKQKLLILKEEENKKLKERMLQQEKDLNSHLIAEKAQHNLTLTSLQETISTLDQTKVKLTTIIDEHNDQVNIQRNQFELCLLEKDAVIADREQKLSRLRCQMADALKGNSWERQQQLDEMRKELLHAQEENDTLRMKMKIITNNKKCPSCEEKQLEI
ncbi:uncharacterized protein LOC131945014 isoform X2 [Physella acuta]|uniref:uncharacterized protein LOC131945014 isoform X2 n=1 Tax=Physella acuta TaxID=109671 RepID=UPI0027DE63C8|nr:uncharacterized protein LOC131945014 isoform X2 [Physella acuta]